MTRPDQRQHEDGRRASDRVSHSRLRELAASLLKVREEERYRVARYLHDDPGQQLSAVHLDLQLLLNDPALSAKARALLQSVDGRVLDSINSVRRMASTLRPRALDEGGLYFALQNLRRDFTARTGLPCALYADEGELKLNEEYSIAIYRICQESLNNIAAHAQAQSAILSLYRIDHALLITICDDGKGIDQADLNKPGSLGLLGIRERVWALGGEISINRDEQCGTLIEILLPLPLPPPAPAPA